ncbi:Holliday junction branch migration protein RuvA [bacterium DOLJORAL78_65_58]|nr:MAG: Holliday junction branch migration protein RuvA [bacterium DOLZORAL124_64_63]PIE76497.1 MAG: Holliday junction branch migration protein RuvA [bacterium DOLJORAL78_65_58]
MIAYLEGIVAAGGTEAVITVGGGIGLDVQLSALAADRLPAVGQPVRLWTHLAVREDQWSLYGFLDAEERQMFRLLITVSGVGPKVAMGMLGKAPAGDIALALRAGDEKALVRLPGIGKKSAQRLVVELGQRIPESVLAGTALEGGGAAAQAAGGLSEALAVMQAMGLSAAAAETALVKARTARPEVAEDLEAWVRAALRGA